MIDLGLLYAKSAYCINRVFAWYKIKTEEKIIIPLPSFAFSF